MLFLLRQTLRESRAISAAGPGVKTEQVPPTLSDGLEIISWYGPLTSAHVEDFPMPSYKNSFVIDLSRVTNVDSRGLGTMLRLIRKAWAGNVAGCFLTPSRAVQLVVEVTRLDRILPLASTMEEARLLIAKDAAAACLRPVADEEKSVLLFTMPSRISADVAEDFGRAVRAEWDSRPSMREIVLDFAETDFIDSSGLGFLIRCHRMTAQREGSRLRLMSPRENILNVIKIAKIQDMLLSAEQKSSR